MESYGDSLDPTRGSHFLPKMLFGLFSHAQIFITSAIPFVATYICLRIRNARIEKIFPNARGQFSQFEKMPSVAASPSPAKSVALQPPQAPKRAASANISDEVDFSKPTSSIGKESDNENLHELGRFDPVFARRVLERLAVEKIPVVTEIDHFARDNDPTGVRGFLWRGEGSLLVIFVPTLFVGRAEKIMAELIAAETRTKV